MNKQDFINQYNKIRNNNSVPFIDIDKSYTIFPMYSKQVKGFIFNDEGIEFILSSPEGIDFKMFVGCEHIVGLYDSSKVLKRDS